MIRWSGVTSQAGRPSNGSEEAADRAAAGNDEVGQLASTFQTVGTEVVKRERKLREQVEQITESDYSRQLKGRAYELRRHDE